MLSPSAPTALRESTLLPQHASLRHTILSGDGWIHQLNRGQRMRILDLEGNQAVDTLFYCAQDPSERYDACRTMRAQSQLYLSHGSRLLSSEGRTLLTITADTCGRHDTVGGACACESNQVRYALDKRYMHACRETFLLELARWDRGLGIRDLTHNINFFMNVPVAPSGELHFADGISASGRYVEMTAEMDVLVLISNCPQLNNPCNGWNPTPVEILIWDAA
jgi:urea carboxylase-associated protein 1